MYYNSKLWIVRRVFSMANYHEMDRDALTAEKAALEQAYKEFQAKGLKLNMARGKPGPHQMDLAMDLLKMTDYTTDAGTDARNYGELEGLLPGVSLPLVSGREAQVPLPGARL